MSTKAAYPFARKEDHYRDFSLAMLRWALKDAAEAFRAVQGWDLTAEGWYRDDLTTIAKEISVR